jgi:hypothetical protein
MDKTEKSSKMLGNFLVDFLPTLYQKVKNCFGLSIRPNPLASIDVIKDLYQVQETLKFFFLTHIQLCVVVI